MIYAIWKTNIMRMNVLLNHLSFHICRVIQRFLVYIVHKFINAFPFNQNTYVSPSSYPKTLLCDDYFNSTLVNYMYYVFPFSAIRERHRGPAPHRPGHPGLRLQHRFSLPRPNGQPGQLLRDQFVHARRQDAHANRHADECVYSAVNELYEDGHFD